MTRRSAYLRTALVQVSLFASTLVACKVEPVLELEPEDIAPARVQLPMVQIPDLAEESGRKSRTEAELRRQIALLTSPYLAGRRPGTEGARLTVAHLERTMQDTGLAPPSFDGGWQQGVSVRVEATESGTILGPGGAVQPDGLLRHGQGLVLWREQGVGQWSAVVEAVEVDWGITAHDLGYDDYAGRNVTGKLVIVRDGVPPRPDFDEEARSDYGSIDYKIERARRVGAIGCLVATDHPATSTVWAELRRLSAAPRVDTGTAEAAARARIAVAGVLSAEASAQLHGWLAASADGRSAAVEVAVNTTERFVTDPNIIGLVVGSEHPEQVVIVKAHWDAGGTSAPLPEGGGAVDNASGVAAMLAAATDFSQWARAGRRAKRSIVFVATASDTLKLAGTRSLSQQSQWRREDVIAAIDLDSLAVRAGGPALGVMGLEDSPLVAELRRLRPSLRQLPDEAGYHRTPGYRIFQDNGMAAVTLTRYDASVANPPEGIISTTGLGDLAEDVELLTELVWRLADADDPMALPAALERSSPANQSLAP